MGGWGGYWKKVNIIAVGECWLLNCFFFFSNHENDSIKNICVYSKNTIKTKVTSKQNLEHFKMINWRSFSHKSFNNPKMLLSSSRAIFIRALVFSFSPTANFSSLKYLYFSFLLVFQFLFSFSTKEFKQKNNYIVIKIERFQLCFIICIDTTNHSHVLFLFN